MKYGFFYRLALPPLLLLSGCGGPSASSTGAAPNPPSAVALVDCQQLSSPVCNLINPGENSYNVGNPSDTSFYGFADPSMRADPNTGTLYMTYSYPRLIGMGGGTTSLSEVHGAQSTNGGTSWSFVSGLFTGNSVSFTDSTGTGTYYTANEVSNILPINQSGSTILYGVHMAYLNKAGNSSTYNNLVNTGYLSVTTSSTGLAGLAVSGSNEGRLGFTSAYTSNSVYVVPAGGPYLSSMNASLSHCAAWNEPALIMQGTTLYLLAQCMFASSVTAPTGTAPATASYAVAYYSYAVFSTTPSGMNPSTWTWSYVGSFANNADAVQLTTQEGVSGTTPYSFFTELDIAQKSNGTLVAVLTPSVGVMGGENHYGCRVIQMNSSLSNPGFAHTASGSLQVLANIQMSDDEPSYSASLAGTGACTYEPNSHTGVVIGRKSISPFTMFLYSSFLSP